MLVTGFPYDVHSRIEEIVGRDLSAPDVRFQLQVALAARRTLTVLHPQGD